MRYILLFVLLLVNSTAVLAQLDSLEANSAEYNQGKLLGYLVVAIGIIIAVIYEVRKRRNKNL